MGKRESGFLGDFRLEFSRDELPARILVEVLVRGLNFQVELYFRSMNDRDALISMHLWSAWSAVRSFREALDVAAFARWVSVYCLSRPSLEVCLPFSKRQCVSKHYIITMSIASLRQSGCHFGSVWRRACEVSYVIASTSWKWETCHFFQIARRSALKFCLIFLSFQLPHRWLSVNSGSLFMFSEVALFLSAPWANMRGSL